MSRYLDDDTRHVRVSIWDGERAVGAIALAEREARRLATFLAVRPGGRPPRPLGRRLTVQLAALSARRRR